MVVTSPLQAKPNFNLIAMINKEIGFQGCFGRVNNIASGVTDFQLQTCSDKLRAILIKSVDSSGKQFSVYRPNIGRGRIEKLSQFLKKHEKVSIEEGKKWWTAEYESSLNTCTHAFS